MSGTDRWYFSDEALADTPSRRCGLKADEELFRRQQTGVLIKDMGRQLNVTSLCINTAIVYMHRFYRFHSFTKFDPNSISTCALFLAAKVEEQKPQIVDIIRIANYIQKSMTNSPDTDDSDSFNESYQEQVKEIVFNENLMLLTLGFDIGVEHPNTSIVKFVDAFKVDKHMAQTAYHLATYSLILTTMCLRYKPTVVSCVCLKLASKWMKHEFKVKEWYKQIDATLPLDLLETLTKEFEDIIKRCPEKWKRPFMIIISNLRKEGGVGGSQRTLNHSTSTVPSVSNIRRLTSTAGPPPKRLKTNESGQQSNKPPVQLPLKRAINGSTNLSSTTTGPKVVNKMPKKSLNMENLVNLKITFSTVNENKTIQTNRPTNKRIVCETTLVSYS